MDNPIRVLNFGETWLRNSKIEFLSYKDVLNAYVGTLNQFSSPVIGFVSHYIVVKRLFATKMT